MRETKESIKRREKITLVLRILFVIMIFAGIILLISIIEKNSDNRETNPDAGKYVVPVSGIETREYEGKTYNLNDKIETVLVLGIDSSREFETGKTFEQADFIFLVVIDHENKKYNAVHINRDTMALVDVLTSAGTFLRTANEQIALSHTYGSDPHIMCRNTMKSVSRLMGDIKIDHFLSLTMDAVPVLNDSVGGVTLEIKEDLGEFKAGETVTLKGDQALSYVRSRDTSKDTSNVERMERQKGYVNELRRLFMSKVQSDSSFAADAILDISKYLVSDMSIEKLSDFVSDLSEYESGEYMTLEGNNVKGETYMEFYPDEKFMDSLIIKLFYK